MSASIASPSRAERSSAPGLKALAAQLAERAPVPDFILRAAIARRVVATRERLALLDGPAEEARFVASMAGRPVAEFTRAANAQHYEVPAGFFALVLGPRRKYSSCLYESESDSLAIAEERALTVTSEHARLDDGQRILELGCGWGSLSLWMAERFSNARILAVSNSRSQREYIEREAVSRELRNLRVVTADMNEFAPGERFDRIVSVEMFEHMANWPALFARVADWLAPDGRVFIHVFAHRGMPYRFDHEASGDWIAKHFFTGGVMPSHGLTRHCARPLTVEEEWRWSGTHYQRTANDWLRNFDRHAREIRRVFAPVYGGDTSLWMRRWRLFFLATAGLFGDLGGQTWGVSHYRLKRAD